MYRFSSLPILILMINVHLFGQTEAVLLLDKSIEFHDPNGKWSTFKAQLDFTTNWLDKPDDKREVFIDIAGEHFQFAHQYENGLLNYEVLKDTAFAKWNGSLEIPKDAAEKWKISKERAILYRDYYCYLYGMPMKLKDPGTIIDPEVQTVEFYGNNYDRIRVSYDPEVGKDIWYFYFNIKTHALEAYQFFHDEAKNDGEYVLFEELKVLDGIKMPRIRKWFYNKDEKYLATDILN